MTPTPARERLRLLTPPPIHFTPSTELSCPACRRPHPSPAMALEDLLDGLSLAPLELLCPRCGWANGLEDWARRLGDWGPAAALAQPA